MKSDPKSKALVVHSYAALDRLNQSVLPLLDFKLKAVGAHSLDELRNELGTGQYPLCIVEHFVCQADPLKLGKPIWDGTPENDRLWIGNEHGGFGATPITALELLPEFHRLCPDTRFVIVSHIRHYGVPREFLIAYEQCPQVVKIIGFINGLVNMRYLARLLTRTYEGRKWKPITLVEAYEREKARSKEI